jgi:hypothetical protein
MDLDDGAQFQRYRCTTFKPVIRSQPDKLPSTSTPTIQQTPAKKVDPNTVLVSTGSNSTIRLQEFDFNLDHQDISPPTSLKPGTKLKKISPPRRHAFRAEINECSSDDEPVQIIPRKRKKLLDPPINHLELPYLLTG